MGWAPSVHPGDEGCGPNYRFWLRIEHNIESTIFSRMVFGKIWVFFSPPHKNSDKLSVPSISKEVLGELHHCTMDWNNSWSSILIFKHLRFHETIILSALSQLATNLSGITFTSNISGRFFQNFYCCLPENLKKNVMRNNWNIKTKNMNDFILIFCPHCH